jgi:hypothetical protein
VTAGIFLGNQPPTKGINMNNEPVAWVVDGVLFTSLGAALNISFAIEQPCIPLYTHPVKEQDAIRYQWLRNEFAHGRFLLHPMVVAVVFYMIGYFVGKN